MLQTIPYFADVDFHKLMPIAINIIPKIYSYGEFILKKGEIPPGLIIINEGQAKVVSFRIGERQLIDNRYGAPSGFTNNSSGGGEFITD